MKKSVRNQSSQCQITEKLLNGAGRIDSTIGALVDVMTLTSTFETFYNMCNCKDSSNQIEALAWYIFSFFVILSS